MTVSAWGGKVSDLNQLIPDRYQRKPPERTPEQKKRDTRSAMRLMGAFFGDKEF